MKPWNNVDDGCKPIVNVVLQFEGGVDMEGYYDRDDQQWKVGFGRKVNPVAWRHLDVIPVYRVDTEYLTLEKTKVKETTPLNCFVDVCYYSEDKEKAQQVLVGVIKQRIVELNEQLKTLEENDEIHT